MQYLYDPQPHGWMARAHQYTSKPSTDMQAQLAQLRAAWRSNPQVKQNLLVVARQVKRYGWKRTWQSYIPLPYPTMVLQEAVRGILRSKLV